MITLGIQSSWDHVVSMPLVSGTILLASGICALVWLRKKYKRLPVDGKAVLITGCDTGIGHELAIHLDTLGFHVFAGCLQLSSAGAQKLKENCSKKLRIFELDVTNQEHLKDALEFVKAELGDRCLWGLVNNAGVLYLGGPEIMPMRVIQRMVDINVVGTIAVTKTFLPLIRRAKGRVVFMSSSAAVCPMQRLGIYCATKAAIDRFAHTLRLEMRSWGVGVSTFLPAGFNTNIMVNVTNECLQGWYQESDIMVKEDYGEDFYSHINDAKEDTFASIQAGKGLTEVTDEITHALIANKPRTYYKPGRGASIMYHLSHWLPVSISDPVLAKLTNFFKGTPKALQASANGI